MKIRSLEDAVDYLFAHIPKTTSTEFPGELGLTRMEALMKLLGDPQEQVSVIHIAGTSGKGSTAFLTSVALQSQGFKVGTHLSPHLLDIRERCLINNTYIPEESFVQYLNEIVFAVDRLKGSPVGNPTYFEILVAMAYYIFYKERVDFAVVETGLGGMFDGTNVVKNPSKISVITQIGKDHTAILGNTLKKIATQKAGIIQSGNAVISVWQHKSAREAIECAVDKAKTSVLWVKKGESYKQVKVYVDKTRFVFLTQNKSIPFEVGLIGSHQAQNATVALTILNFVTTRNNSIVNIPALQKSFKDAHFAGRMDLRIHKKTQVVLDGAHNPQKMRQLLINAKNMYPGYSFDFLLAFKQGKDAQAMIRMIAQHADHVTLAPFFISNQDMKHLSQDPLKLREAFQKEGIKDITVVSSAQEGYQHALQHEPKVLIITGSLYFLSEVYKLTQNH